jgi:hypothetical protein
MEFRQRHAPWRDYTAVQARPAHGAATFTGAALASKLKQMAEARPGWEFHATLDIEGIGHRDIVKWFSKQTLDEAAARGEDHLDIVFDVQQYDGIALEDREGMRAVDRIKTATILMRAKPGPVGGCSGSTGRTSANDCLSKALAQAFEGCLMPPLKLPDAKRCHGKYLSNNAVLKKFLGLPVDAKVPLSKMPMLEAALTTTIHVHGTTPGCSYASAAKYQRVLHLKLSDEHFTICAAPDRKPALRGKADRPVLTAEDAVAKYGQDQVTAWRRNPYSAPVVILPRGVDPQDFRHFRALLLEHTKIDIVAFNGRTKPFVLELFRQMSRVVPVSAPLSALEVTFLLGAQRGGLIASAPRKELPPFCGPAAQYDFTSFYPSILASTTFNVPNSTGEPVRLAPSPRKFYPIGLYRATVSNLPPQYRRLWNQPLDRVAFFTHTDLATALLLGATVALADDGQLNAILYLNDQGRSATQRIKGSDAFKPFVTKLFALKQQGVEGAKLALNMLSGALYERDKAKKVVSAQEYERRATAGELPEPPADLRRAFFYDDGTFVVEEYTTEFRGPYPRVGAFLTAKGRHIMAKTLKPLVDAHGPDVLVRCHTDGFLLRGCSHPQLTPLVSLTIQQAELGSLKLERSSDKCTATGLRKPVWD